MMSKSNETDRRPWWLKIPTGCVIAAVCLIGVSYVAYFVHLLAISKDCKSYSGIWFVQDCLATLPTNNIGDALGGAFAPLAFIFLAGALIIQAMELAAQRYEIDETQQVMRAQVTETQASTALLKIQTEILQTQHKLRLEEQANDEFDKKIYQIRMFLTSGGGALSCKIFRNNSEFGEDVRVYGDSDATSDVAFYVFFLRIMKDATRTLEAPGITKVTISEPNRWNEMQTNLSTLREISHRCSPSYKSLAAAHQVEEIAKAFHQFYEKIQELESA